MNPKIERLKAMAEELRQMFPGKDPELWAHSDGRLDLSLHGPCVYADSTPLFRELGIGKREKHVFNPENPWFCATGETEGVLVKFFGKGLPNTCRVETFTEKIPKQQTVTTDEFVEIQRARIVCGEPEKEEA